MKNAKLFILNFQKFIMPWLDHFFENENLKEEVMSLLQQVQKAVSYLQELFTNTYNSSISKQIPAYKRTIGQFLIRLRQMLYVNNSDDLLNIDNLEKK